jgi:hypothetical protein
LLLITNRFRFQCEQFKRSPRRAASHLRAPAAREALRDVELTRRVKATRIWRSACFLNLNLRLPARSHSRTFNRFLESILWHLRNSSPTVSVFKIWLRTISVRVLISAMFQSVILLLCNNKQIRRLEGAAMRDCPATAAHLRISVKAREKARQSGSPAT